MSNIHVLSHTIINFKTIDQDFYLHEDIQDFKTDLSKR